jgi:hypothetical protein
MMVGGALGIAFVVAKLAVAFGATTVIVTGVKYFNEWKPAPRTTNGKKNKVESPYEGMVNDDDNSFENIRSKFRGGY